MSVVRSRKKEREAPESRVKVWEAEADAVPERAESPAPEGADARAPRAAASLAPRAAASPVPRAEVSMPRVERKTPVTVTLITNSHSIHGSKNSIKVKVKDSYSRPRKLALARDLSGLRELVTPSVRQAAKAVLGRVCTPALLTCAVAAPPPPPPASSTAATSATSAPTPTAAAASASTAATDTSTPATTPTATPTPSTASTASSTAPASSSNAPASLALARAASPARGRRRTDRLKPNEVGRGSRGNRGQKGGRGTPLKDGGARVTTRGSYNYFALLCC
ncbi:unnamed protein product [Closterium sp. NIES-64]|nr:unnamed protein product [Closterium sp. NIES-64]